MSAHTGVREAVTLAQLAGSAERLAQLLDQVADERQRRDQMIVALVDQHEDRGEIAKAGRVSPKSICTALATYG